MKLKADVVDGERSGFALTEALEQVAGLEVERGVGRQAWAGGVVR
jgi:hypothetical protein